jgi:hypothetical protein
MESKIHIDFNDGSDRNCEFIAELLGQYQEVIRSSICALNGKLKFVSGINNAENLIVTNTSRHLISCLYKSEHFVPSDGQRSGFVAWQFDMIKSVVQAAHLNHFYDSGLFLCHLVNELLICFNKENTHSGAVPKVPKSLFDKPDIEFKSSKSINDFLFKNLIDNLIKSTRNDQLESSLVGLKLNLNGLGFLKRLLSTVLNSKCIVDQLDTVRNERFLNLCTRAFIKSFHTSSEANGLDVVYFSSIVYLFTEDLSTSLSESSLYEGVLFKLDKNQIDEDFEIDKASQLKCVLFDTNAFSGDFELMENSDFKLKIEASDRSQVNSKFMLVDSLKRVCYLLVDKFKINVLLCQKVRILLKSFQF